MSITQTLPWMLWRSLLILHLIFFWPSAHAQVQNHAFVPVAPEILSSSFVRCVLKDNRGFMWFGTTNGLIRFDGTNTYKYEYNPADSTSIPYNNITVIFEDADHTLWIGTAQGLARYNQERDNFSNLDSVAGNKNHLNNRYITCLTKDNDGRVWIGTHGDGINIYDPQTLTFTYLKGERISGHQPTTNYVNSFLLVGNTMWVGTKGGLKFFDVKDYRQSTQVVDKEMTSKEITQVTRDPAGNIWLGSVDGEIIKMTLSGGLYHPGLKKTVLSHNRNDEGSDNILTLCHNKTGGLWIGGENAGLNYLDTKTNKVIRHLSVEGDPKRIPTNSIRCVYVDNTGITWVGTHNRGVFMLDNYAKKFESYQRNAFVPQSLLSNSVRSFAEDKNGNIWMACYGGGLSKLDVKTHQIVNDELVNKKLATKYVTALLYDAEGYLWIGTWGRGLYKLNLQTLEMRHYNLQSNGFGDNKVLTIYQDKRKNIWVGTVGSGLFYFDSKTQSFVSLDEGLSTDHLRKTVYVSGILERADNTLWVATLFGLYELKRKSDFSFSYVWYHQNSIPRSINSFNIQTIYEDSNKTLWIGTGDNGVTFLTTDNPIFQSVQKRDGLASNTIGAILSDHSGNVWIGTNAGLSKFNSATRSFVNYTKDDGLVSNEFYSNACLKGSDGKFYFGTDKGFVAFYPDSIGVSPIKPVVTFADFKVNNQPVEIGAEDSPLQKHISLTREIELTHNQRSFIVDFVAINYGQSSRSQYCYKLDGFDDDWNCSGSNRSATYTNLDPGHYVFFVKAVNSEGIWSEVPARLDITIYPAPWNTWWAKLLYVVIFTGFIFFLIKIRTDRIHMNNQLELERLAHEQEHALNESKTQFFTNISHEFRTPLSLILMPLERMISTDEFPAAVKERLITVHKSANKMMRLVSELMDFNKLESAEMKLHVQQGELIEFIKETASVFDDLAIKKNIQFGVNTVLPSVVGWFDHDKLEKILINVLSNAFKFTADRVNILIDVKGLEIKGKEGLVRCIELHIVDNGIGISPEELPYIFDKFYQAMSSTKIPNPGTGIGLSLTKGLVTRHHGSIEVKSKPNQETCFRIVIPIERGFYSEEEVRETPMETNKISYNNTAGIFEMTDTPSATNQDKPQILVVEDNEELRKYMAMELRQEFSVLEAEDGLIGFEIACEKSPDLIISDVLMPIRTGIELCRSIKSDIKTSHIPFILLTAKTTVEDQITGIETGADVYITKPFSFRFLVAHIRQIIHSRQQLYTRFSQDVYLLPSKATSNEIDQAFLQKAIDYIIENIQDPQLGVDSLAELFNLSRMQLYRKVKAITGKSVVEFVRMVRVKQALVLMEKQQHTLSEIAFQTGFNSASYFTRCFKDQYGKAPSEYLENRS